VERLLAAQQGDLLGRNYRPLDQGLRGQYDPHLLPKPVTGKKEEKEQPKPKDEPLVE